MHTGSASEIFGAGMTAAPAGHTAIGEHDRRLFDGARKIAARCAIGRSIR